MFPHEMPHTFWDLAFFASVLDAFEPNVDRAIVTGFATEDRRVVPGCIDGFDVERFVEDAQENRHP